jgi:hypothetical protein
MESFIRVQRGALFQTQQCVGQRVRLEALGLAVQQAVHKPAKIFDQNDAQADRQRPDLADRQRVDALISPHEPAKPFGVKTAVRVGDESPSNPVNAGSPFKEPLRKLWKPAIEFGWKVVVNFEDLFLDDVKIVHEPLGGGSDRALVSDVLSNPAVGVAQDAAINLDPTQNRASFEALLGDTLRLGEAFGVLFQPFYAEQFGPNEFGGFFGA